MEERILQVLEYVAIAAAIIGGWLALWVTAFGSHEADALQAYALLGLSWAVIPWCIVSIEHHRIMRKRWRDER